MARRFKRTMVLAAAAAFAGIPLVTTATCDPYTRTFTFYRDDDYEGDDWGFFDLFIYDDYYYPDCSYGCYDDYWGDDVYYYP
jgi:hypothetical protein